MSLALEAAGLSLTHLSRHGAVPALRGVSFSVAAGEAVAVVGRSGCGKTTLARLLTGLPPARATVAGTLRWPGGAAPVAGARRAGLGRQVAWLPQDGIAALHPLLTVGAQIAETLRAAGRPPTHASLAAALAEVELDPALAPRYPHALSGGQGQRVALACALAQRPAVLVADEPTSALDAASGGAILRLLHGRRRAHGMALVLVTHDLSAAAAFCDRIVVLQDGAVVEDGPSVEVTAAPRSAAAAELLAALRCHGGAPRCSARAA